MKHRKGIDFLADKASAGPTHEGGSRRSTVVIDTLGKLADGGYSFSVWCPSCERGGLVSAEVVALKVGRHHPVCPKGRIYCSKCLSREIEIRLSPGPKPRG